MGLLTDAGLDSGAYRNRLLSSTNGLQYWDESVGKRMFGWNTVQNRWDLLYGDTGNRDVSASCSTGTATIFLRRCGSVVTVTFSAFAPGSTGDKALITLPSGFRPAATTYGTANDSGTLRVADATSAGVTTVRAVAGVAVAGTLTFQTIETFPVTLPGSASGAIPFA
jgi:hypothetical protein